MCHAQLFYFGNSNAVRTNLWKNHKHILLDIVSHMHLYHKHNQTLKCIFGGGRGEDWLAPFMQRNIEGRFTLRQNCKGYGKNINEDSRRVKGKNSDMTSLFYLIKCIIWDHSWKYPPTCLCLIHISDFKIRATEWANLCDIQASGASYENRSTKVKAMKHSTHLTKPMNVFIGSTTEWMSRKAGLKFCCYERIMVRDFGGQSSFDSPVYNYL